MKINYFLKSFTLVALMAMFVNVSASEFRVPNGATSADLVAVLEGADHGDIIWIDGWVTIDEPVVVEKNVTFRAGTANSGFEGDGNTRLFQLNPEPIDGHKLLFDNLGFMGGNALANYVPGEGGDDGAGGVAKIDGNGSIEFVLCYFDDNKAKRGGAFFIAGSDEALNPTSVNFRGCDASANMAITNELGEEQGESRGGYLFTDGNTYINHEYCIINGNKSIGGRGGAFCLFGNGTRRFYYCVINDNTAGNWTTDDAGLPLEKIDYYGNVVNDGWEFEGAVAFITNGATIFESCGFAGNKSWSHSGLIRGWGDQGSTVTFINSTLANNQSLHDRSPLWIGGNAEYTFVNSIVAGNKGQNMGNGAGFDFDGANVKLNLFNSAIIRNEAGSDGYVDIRNASDYAQQLTVKNSIIGIIQAGSVEAQDDKSIVNMFVTVPGMEAAPVAESDPLDISGIDFASGLRSGANGGSRMPYYLLIADGYISKLGDPELLAEYDTMSDVFGRERTIAADGSISAAPTLVSTPNNFDDRGWRDNIVLSDKTLKLTEGNISASISDGILSVNFGELKGRAKGALLNIAGQEVEKVFDCMVISKGFYNTNVTQGIYILKVEIGGNTYAQKIVVTK